MKELSPSEHMGSEPQYSPEEMATPEFKFKAAEEEMNEMFEAIDSAKDKPSEDREFVKAWAMSAAKAYNEAGSKLSPQQSIDLDEFETFVDAELEPQVEVSKESEMALEQDGVQDALSNLKKRRSSRYPEDSEEQISNAVNGAFSRFYNYYTSHQGGEESPAEATRLALEKVSELQNKGSWFATIKKVD